MKTMEANRGGIAALHGCIACCFFWGGVECKTLQALETMGPPKPTFLEGFYGRQPGF